MKKEVVRQDVVQIGFEVDDNPLLQLNKELKDFQKSITGIETDDTFNEMESNVSDVSDALEDTLKNIDDVIKTTKSAGDEFDQLKDTTKELPRVIGDVEQQAQGLRDKIKDIASVSLDKIKSGFSSVKSTFIALSPHVDKLDSKLNSIIKKVGGAAFSGIKKLTKGAVVGVTALGGAMGWAAVNGVKYNAEMEQYNTSFKTMLGSQKAGIKMTKDLKKMAAKTPFEMTDVAKGAQTLMGFGRTAKQTKKDMEMLGDVSQGNTEQFQSLTLAFAQIQAAGKLQGQDLLQLINAGFNPLQEISKQTGKSLGVLKEEMSKGAISADMVTSAFERATSKGGRFYKSMDKQSRTFNGQMATLKDNAMSMLGDVTAGLSDTLKDTALPMVNGYMDELSKAFKKGGISGLLSSSGGIFADILRNAAKKAPQLVNAGGSFIKAFLIGIRENIPAMRDSVVNMIGSVLENVGDITAELIRTVYEAITGQPMGVDEFRELKQSINTAIETLKNLGKIAGEIGVFVVKNIKPIMTVTLSLIAAVKAYRATMFAMMAVEKMNMLLKSVSAIKSNVLAASLGMETKATFSATVAQYGLNAAFLACPLTWIVLGIAAVALGIYAFCRAVNTASPRSDEFNRSLAEMHENAEQFGKSIDAIEPAIVKYDKLLSSAGRSMQSIDEGIEKYEGEITSVLKTAYSKNQELRDEDIKNIEKYQRKLMRLEREKLSIYDIKQSATNLQVKEALKKGYDPLELEQYRQNASSERDETRKAVESVYQDELVRIQNRYKGNLKSSEAQKAMEAATSRRDKRLTRADALYNRVEGTILKGAGKNLLGSESMSAAFGNLDNARSYYDNAGVRSAQRAALAYSVPEKVQIHEAEVASSRAGIEEALKGIADNEELRNQINGMFFSIFDAKEAGRKIPNETKKAASLVLNSFSSLPEDMQESGRMTLEGLIGGMKEKIPGLEDTAKMTAGTLANNLRESLDINSPSRVAFGIGEYVGAGLVEGMRSVQPKIKTESETMGENAMFKYSPTNDASRNQKSGQVLSISEPKFSITINGGDTGKETERKVKKWLKDAWDDMVDSFGDKDPQLREV